MSWKGKAGLIGVALATVTTAALVLTTAGPAGATPGVWQSEQHASGISVSSRVVTAPTGIQSGDFLLAQVTTNHENQSGVGAPTGWTTGCVSPADATHPISTALYYRVAGGSEPSSYTWTFPAGSSAVVAISRYTGIDTTNPLDLCVLGNAGAHSSSAPYTVSYWRMETTGGDEVVGEAVGFLHAGTVSESSGYTERYDLHTSSGVGAISQEMADTTSGSCSAGPCLVDYPGSAIITMIGGEPAPVWVNLVFALRPATGVAPTNVSRPTITGNSPAGSVVSATTGVWKGNPTYAYQWQKCTPVCSDIVGATSSTYTTQAGDVGAWIQVNVTATNSGGSTTVGSLQGAGITVT